MSETLINWGLVVALIAVLLWIAIRLNRIDR